MKKALVVSCFDWYEKRLEPIIEILSSEYQVETLTSDYDHIKKTTIEKRHKTCSYVHVLPYKKNISVRRILSHLKFGMVVNKYLKKYSPDLIYLLLPPNNTAIYCLSYKRKHEHVKYIVDIIDMWPESMPIGRVKDTIIGNLWRNLRDNSLREANLIITECGLYQDKLKYALKNKKTCINYIFKDCDENLVSDIVNRKNNHIFHNRIVLGYVGSINNILDIDKVRKILESLKEAGYFIVCKVIGDGDHKDQFLSILKDMSLVEYFGKVFDEEEKYKILRDCDFGFNIMKSTVAVGLTIKSLDYFSYGIPILNNIQGDTWNLVEQLGLGINVSDDMCALINDIKTKKIDRRRVIDCFTSNFTKEAYVINTRKALAMIGVIK